MATRILVRCKTNEMPGPMNEKIPLMANTACRKVWDRDFDQEHDRFVSHGGWMNPRCVLLIDHGPIDAMEHVIHHLAWREGKLMEITGLLPNYIQNQLDTMYHFNPTKRPVLISYTDEELEVKIGSKNFEKYVMDRDAQLARFKANIDTEGNKS